jgi:succinate dehydrogenase/fumarate reductase flavoprotein subunit
MMIKKEVQRREFIKTAAAITVSATAAAVTGTSPSNTALAACGVPDKWDYQADVVIVGYGGAGAAAAIAANDSKAKVLVLEKARFGGGNTGVCSGIIVIYPDLNEAVGYFRSLTQGTVADEDLIRTFIRARQELPGRLKELGLDIGMASTTTFAAAVVGGRKQTFATYPGGTGEAMFRFLNEQVVKRKIQIMYATPAKGLIQNPDTREIVGLRAESYGKAITVKANRSVIMACGGYENNPEMKGWYNFPGIVTFPAGTPSNQGDGINMVSEIGAPLWHITGLEIGVLCHKKPSEKYGVAFDLFTSLQGGFICVNRSGRRFMLEGQRIAHRKGGVAVLDLDYEKGEYVNWPAFMILDENCRLKGPLWAGRSVQGKNTATYAAVHNLYEWSSDNSAEIAGGWLLKADTIPELATKAGIDPTGLQETIRRHNEFCVAKKDADFNRDPSKLFPISRPPYYCSELALSVYSTTAGPVHNAKCEVLGKDKKPIPGLYAAGEFGSLLGYLVPAGNCFPEALSFGFIAGVQAAAQRPR